MRFFTRRVPMGLFGLCVPNCNFDSFVQIKICVFLQNLFYIITFYWVSTRRSMVLQPPKSQCFSMCFEGYCVVNFQIKQKITQNLSNCPSLSIRRNPLKNENIKKEMWHYGCFYLIRVGLVLSLTYKRQDFSSSSRTSNFNQNQPITRSSNCTILEAYFSILSIIF